MVMGHKLAPPPPQCLDAIALGRVFVGLIKRSNRVKLIHEYHASVVIMS